MILPQKRFFEALKINFLQNKSIIYAINIRTFNAKDTNRNELIDPDEESGNFLNAIERLDEVKDAAEGCPTSAIEISE